MLDSHDGAEKCWSETCGSDRSTRTAQRTNQRGTRIRQHHINQINHETDHSDQSAHGPISDGNSSHDACDNVCRATVSVSSNPRASAGQDALTFCPSGQSLTVGKMDAATPSRQIRSLRLLFGSAVGRSELLHQTLLETLKRGARRRRTTEYEEQPKTATTTNSSTPDATGRVLPVVK